MPALAGLLSGCDIVQGFQNAGDALFPPVKTYLDAPGYRVLSGNHTAFWLLTGEELYLAARSTSAADDLTLSHYAKPSPCVLPRVGYFDAYGPPGITGLVITYFNDWWDGGTLRFADGSCRELPLSVENARMPVFAGSDGRLLVQSGTDLLAVDPLRGESVTIATNVTSIVDAPAFPSAVFVAGGLLGVVDNRDSRLVQWFGARVVNAVSADSSVFFEDRAGVHELAATDLGDTTLIAETRVERRACRLARLPAPEAPGEYARSEWVGYNLPCDTDNFVLRDARADLKLTLFGYPIDARHAKVVVLTDPTASEAAPSITDPLVVFYLTDVEPETGEGELHLLDVAGDRDVVLGRTSAVRRALLARRTLAGEPGYDHGYALLDLEHGSGRYVVWEFDGTTREVARNVVDADLYSPWPAVLADFDGTSGTFAQLAGGALHELGSKVPLYGGAMPDYHDYRSGKALLMSDFDGYRGTLSLLPPLAGKLDDFGHPLRQAQPVARDVGQYQRNFLGPLPGFIYVTAYDPATGTGRLEYQNTELGFTSIVSEGVADMSDTGTNVVYSILHGENAGIWVARKK